MLRPKNSRSLGFRLDGDSHFQVAPMISDQVQVRLKVLTGQTCPWLPTIVDFVLRVIAMFTVNLFFFLVSFKHEGLGPEWWSYRTRECCFSQSQRHLCDFIWLLLRRSLLNPRLVTFWNFLPPPGGSDWWHKLLSFQNDGGGVKKWWKMHMMADCAILNIPIYQKNKCLLSS